MTEIENVQSAPANQQGPNQSKQIKHARRNARSVQITNKARRGNQIYFRLKHQTRRIAQLRLDIIRDLDELIHVVIDESTLIAVIKYRHAPSRNGETVATMPHQDPNDIT